MAISRVAAGLLACTSRVARRGELARRPGGLRYKDAARQRPAYRALDLGRFGGCGFRPGQYRPGGDRTRLHYRGRTPRLLPGCPARSSGPRSRSCGAP